MSGCIEQKPEFIEVIIMLTTKATPEMIAEWAQIFETHRATMHPNRKTGAEVDAYFRKNYACQLFEDREFRRVVESNIMENEHSRNKLPKGIFPDIMSYRTADVYVGIDLSSGEFHIESDDTSKVISIYEDIGD